jgi:hypothetical protein
MSDVPPLCAICGGTCEEGFLRDIIELGSMTAGMWVEGQPEFAFGGTLVGGAHRRHYRLQAFRCVKCGKVELLAVTRSELRTRLERTPNESLQPTGAAMSVSGSVTLPRRPLSAEL